MNEKNPSILRIKEKDSREDGDIKVQHPDELEESNNLLEQKRSRVEIFRKLLEQEPSFPGWHLRI